MTKKPTEQKDVNEPVFSPDGKYLYYSEDVSPGKTFEYSKDPHKQIYAIKRLELATDETESYITGPGGACRPTPSPDGKTIAFVRRVDGKTGLHLFDSKTGAIRLPYDQLERDMQETWAIHGVYPSFQWTPDAKAIVVWAKGKIRRIEVADGSASVIPFTSWIHEKLANRSDILSKSLPKVSTFACFAGSGNFRWQTSRLPSSRPPMDKRPSNWREPEADRAKPIISRCILAYPATATM